MKTFPFINILDRLSKKYCLKRTSQLFLISLIAHYHEKERSGGKVMGLNISQEEAIYKIILSENEITKKFGFCKDTIISTRKDLLYKLNRRIKINVYGATINTFGNWRLKSINFTNKYEFKIIINKNRIVYVPTKIIYDKNLHYSERLALVWNICLEDQFRRKPKLKEIEMVSGITERTIRKGEKKYPHLF